VPIVESAFNPSALSRAKAKGLWQFIPSTGKQYGLKQDFFIDERSSVEKATVAAAQYLKNLYAMFGDWNLALAGYNAGEGNVQRAIRRAQTSDFWALAKTRSFRAETKNYVPLIHAAIVIAKSPESYGINVAPEDLVSAETVRVAGSYPITTVARCANAEPGDIRQLNPELRRGMTPSSAFDLKVPHGAAEQVTTCLATEKAMNYARHVVRKRDTFSLIAKMFGVSAGEIARVNGLTLQSRLRPGTELAIPRPSRTSSAKVAVAGKSGATPSSDTTYRIRKGDTLSSLAARHSTTVEAIKALNGLSSSRLSIGQVLRVASASNESSPE
jgi:membrane-bound lytic murein transglycosylase D